MAGIVDPDDGPTPSAAINVSPLTVPTGRGSVSVVVLANVACWLLRNAVGTIWNEEWMA